MWKAVTGTLVSDSLMAAFALGADYAKAQVTTPSCYSNRGREF